MRFLLNGIPGRGVIPNRRCEVLTILHGDLLKSVGDHDEFAHGSKQNIG